MRAAILYATRDVRFDERVLGTGWFAAEAADVKPGGTLVVVGDDGVGLLGNAIKSLVPSLLALSDVMIFRI